MSNRRIARGDLSTYMEFAQGVRDKNELRLLRQTIGLNGWRILPLTESIGHRATVHIENCALAHGLRLADAPIAASSADSGNAKRYRCIPDISLASYTP